jgi:hypothetical protein
MPENLPEKDYLDSSPPPEKENLPIDDTGAVDTASLSSSIDQIRHTPSVESWTEELNSILEGRRDVEIERLGDVSRHIKVIISGAKFPHLAQQTFWRALDDLLQRWQPESVEPLGRLYCILSLIAAFTPKIGFVKLAGYLKNDNQFYGNYETPMGWEINLQLQALCALEEYYPVAPLSSSEDASYQTYLDILRLNLERAEYFGYCAARLIDLKELSYNSPEVLGGVVHHQSGLEEIISQIFEPFKPATAGRNLGYLYAHCKRNRLDSYFEECLMPYGKIVEQPEMLVTHDEGRIDQHRHPGVYLARQNNTTIEIPLTENDMRSFYKRGDPDLSRLRDLIEEYRSPRNPMKKISLEEIAEELSAIIEKAAATRQSQIRDIEQRLKSFGGKLSHDNEDFSFVLDEKNNIPLNITPKTKVLVLVETHKEKATENNFWQLTERREHSFKQDGGH